MGTSWKMASSTDALTVEQRTGPLTAHWPGECRCSARVPGCGPPGGQDVRHGLGGPSSGGAGHGRGCGRTGGARQGWNCGASWDLPIVPSRPVAECVELDVTAVLERRPSLALVDDLARPNPSSGQRRTRWKDVQELLTAGIDVVSKVNVEELESLADVVERITGQRPRASAPNAVIRGADQVEVVDMAPEALRRRLAYGNVVGPGQVDAALSDYYRVGTLTALREPATRSPACPRRGQYPPSAPVAIRVWCPHHCCRPRPQSPQPPGWTLPLPGRGPCRRTHAMFGRTARIRCLNAPTAPGVSPGRCASDSRRSSGTCRR